jgi:hypothetical protein
MIQCHAFNSFARLEDRRDGPYVLSQFVGGMAAPLFLFMAGMTLAFQMDSLERREPRRLQRWIFALRRAGYILAIAFAFRISCFIAGLPQADPREIVKVDILNCMGVGLAAVAAVALFQWKQRARFAVAAGVAIAAAAPIMANLPWAGAPQVLREYLVPVPGSGHFPFFPCAAYAAFGVAAGSIVKRTEPGGFDRLMQWSVIIGFPLILAAQYFSSLPFSIYPRSNFWTNGPALILIRLGIMMLLMSASYIWTTWLASRGWSWVECLGKNSLMVYWVHVMLVYGDIVRPVKRRLTIPETALATVVVIVLMVALSALWLRWKTRRADWKAERRAAAVTIGLASGR